MTLRPLPYHEAVTAILERENPQAFAAMSPGPTGGPELDAFLLRSTYRLDPASHPAPHEALARAAGALGVAAPAELYVTEDPGHDNAELFFAPDRVVVLVTGRLLDLLDATELTAILGHELAHHVLWSADGGRFLAASRLLEAAELDARTPGEYLETARRFRLATELYADRGAVVAAGAVEPAVSALLKVSTGMRQVDPAAYLRQAAEVDFSGDGASGGVTHPENVMRAWALQRWYAVPGDDLALAEEQVAGAIGPALDLAALDLLGQDALLALTRELVRQAVLVEHLRAPESLELAGRYGVTAPPAASPLSELSDDDLSGLPPDTRRYLCAVLADLATADPDSSHQALSAAVAVAGRKHLQPDLVRLLVGELGLGDRDKARVVADARAMGVLT